MKKIITVIYTLSFVIGAVSAQSVYDGVKIADKDLNGTARFVGMGGAMGGIRWRYNYNGDKSCWYWYLSE